jgi:hypothetical protein
LYKMAESYLSEGYLAIIFPSELPKYTE